MHGGSKQLDRKLETLPNVEMKEKEQQDPDKKAHDSLDNLIKQTIGREQFLSFTRVGESPVQWIQFFDTLDQNASKASKGLKVEAGVENSGQEDKFKPGNIATTVGGMKDFVHSSMKGNGVFGRGIQASADRMQSLKLPEAVVAFAQAAAKANDMPGWPLMTPKVQVQKCGKCAQEFYSTLNYRRHIRTHRRSFKLDKEDQRIQRKQLGAFWDKLTLEEACQIVAVRNSLLEDLSGSSVARALSAFIQQPGLPSLPQSYIKAGAVLLDIVQNKISSFPLPSEEFFSILDDCGEKTFLCGAQSASMQRFIFEGEAGKVGVESKNLVASLGFLIEQRLVNAWMADKDVEALRCQKALVDEEEASKKKREKLEERKQLKKIRRKELKDRDLRVSEPAPSIFQMCNEAENGEMCSGHHGGDDSSTATQSSSSGYSRQECSNPDSSNMELNDFEGSDNSRMNNIFLRLADKESSVGADEQEERGCTGLPGDVSRNADVEKAAASAGCRMQGAGQHFPANDKGMDTVDQDNTEEATDMQNEHSQHAGTSFMDLTTHNMARPVLDRKTGRGWWEKKRYDSNDFTGNPKSLYGIDKRVYDIDSSQASRFTRKPYNVDMTSTQDYMGVLAHSKSFTGPRYGQYRDKPLGVRRFLPAAGNSHAVWTRKVHQNPVHELDKLGKLNGASDGQGLEFCNNMPLVSDASGLADACAKADSLLDVCESNSDKISAKPNYDIFATEATSWVGSSESLVSSSVQPRAEEQATDVNICTPANDAEITDSSWQTVDNSCALVIGSLSIPLGYFSDTKYSGKLEAISEQLSREIEDLSEENFKGEIASIVSTNKQDDGASLKLVKEPLVLDYEAEPAVCNIPRESFDSGDVPYQKSEISESLPQITPGLERSTKQGHWPNAMHKLSTVKVWRPVGGVTERHEAQVIDLISRVDDGLILVGEEDKLGLHCDSSMAEVGSNRRICLDFDKESIDTNDDDTSVSVGTLSKYAEEPPNVSIAGSTDVKFLKVDEILETIGYEAISGAFSPETVANFLSQRWSDAVTTSESTVLVFDTNGALPVASGAEMDVPDQIQQDSSVSHLSSEAGKLSNLKQQHQNCSSLKSDIDSRNQSGTVGLESGSIRHPLCIEADSDLHTSTSNATGTTVYRVDGSEERGEASLLSGPSNGKINSEKVHRISRTRVLEPRYMPRQRDLEEN